MKCSSRDCLHDAVVAPTIRLWAAGYPKDSHQPIEGTLAVPLCLACAAHFSIKNFTTLQESRDALTAVCAVQGKAAPDFSTAELRMDPIEKMPGFLVDLVDEQPMGRA